MHFRYAHALVTIYCHQTPAPCPYLPPAQQNTSNNPNFCSCVAAAAPSTTSPPGHGAQRGGQEAYGALPPTSGSPGQYGQQYPARGSGGGAAPQYEAGAPQYGAPTDSAAQNGAPASATPQYGASAGAGEPQYGALPGSAAQYSAGAGATQYGARPGAALQYAAPTYGQSYAAPAPAAYPSYGAPHYEGVFIGTTPRHSIMAQMSPSFCMGHTAWGVLNFRHLVPSTVAAFAWGVLHGACTLSSLQTVVMHGQQTNCMLQL